MFQGPHRVVFANGQPQGCEYCGGVPPFAPGSCPNSVPIQPQVGKNIPFLVAVFSMVFVFSCFNVEVSFDSCILPHLMVDMMV
jgi:hypothetical protein